MAHLPRERPLIVKLYLAEKHSSRVIDADGSDTVYAMLELLEEDYAEDHDVKVNKWKVYEETPPEGMREVNLLQTLDCCFISRSRSILLHVIGTALQEQAVKRRRKC